MYLRVYINIRDSAMLIMQRRKRIMRRKDNRLGYGNQYLDVFKTGMLLHLRQQPDIWIEPQIARELAWKLARAVMVLADRNAEEKIDKATHMYDVEHWLNPEAEFKPKTMGIPTLADKKQED